MPNETLIPVFEGATELSLRDLDRLGAAIRNAQPVLTALPGVPVRGGARADRAWYVPTAIALGDGAPGTCILPGTIGGVEFSSQWEAPLIIDGKMYLPLAHNAEALDDEGGTSIVCYPGALKAVSVQSENAAAIKRGILELPLARTPETQTNGESGEEEVTKPGWPGLVAHAVFRADIEQPRLRGGVLQLPLAQYASGTDGIIKAVTGGIAGLHVGDEVMEPRLDRGWFYFPTFGAPAAYFSAATSVTAGTIKAALVSAVSCIEAVSGVLYFPLAECAQGDIACTVSSIPGVIAGVEVKKGLTAPYIQEGKLYLPEGGGFTDAAISSVSRIELVSGVLYFPLAECAQGDIACTVSSIPGAIAGVEVKKGLTAPYIREGKLYLPEGGGAADFVGSSENVAGTIKAAVVSAVSEVSAFSGVLYFPLAEVESSSGSTVEGVPGFVAGVTLSEEVSEPYIKQGVLHLPAVAAEGAIKGVVSASNGRSYDWAKIMGNPTYKIRLLDFGAFDYSNGAQPKLMLYVTDAGYLSFSLVS